MRTIKFRGRDTNGMWYYGFYQGSKNIAQIVNLSDVYNVIGDTVGQFTGLFDKNGAEIYEGDIVEIIHPCWVAQCETKFIDGAFFFCEKNNPVNNSWVRADKFLKQSWDIKVIGKIHDNPELLTTK